MTEPGNTIAEENHPLEFAKKQYRLQLAHHDWWYSMSDDPSVHRRGAEQRAVLLKIRFTLDQDNTIWNSYCPKEFIRK